MNNLDDVAAMKKLDVSNMYGSVYALRDQCLHAWEDTKDLIVPDSYRRISKIAMTGMGGSGLGARVIESLYGSKLKYPLVRLNDYDLPDWADEQTLVICSSFSGTTEETVENARQAQKRGCKWMAIGSGCTLIDYARECHVPYYQINPLHNPSRQPRMAMGYSIVGQLVMSMKAGIIDLSKNDLEGAVREMDKVRRANDLDVPEAKNPGKQLARKLHGKAMIFATARHMVGAVHTVKNQGNENAKTFTSLFDIPELNHHLMEGLSFPQTLKPLIGFIFVTSDLFPQRLRKRIEITIDVVHKSGLSVSIWQAHAQSELSQVFEFIQFGGFVNHYLAMLNEIDPAAIPWVDYFKVQLGQPLGQWK